MTDGEVGSLLRIGNTLHVELNIGHVAYRLELAYRGRAVVPVPDTVVTPRVRIAAQGAAPAFGDSSSLVFTNPWSARSQLTRPEQWFRASLTCLLYTSPSPRD